MVQNCAPGKWMWAGELTSTAHNHWAVLVQAANIETDGISVHHPGTLLILWCTCRSLTDLFKLHSNIKCINISALRTWYLSALNFFSCLACWRSTSKPRFVFSLSAEEGHFFFSFQDVLTMLAPCHEKKSIGIFRKSWNLPGHKPIIRSNVTEVNFT